MIYLPKHMVVDIRQETARDNIPPIHALHTFANSFHLTHTALLCCTGVHYIRIYERS